MKPAALCGTPEDTMVDLNMVFVIFSGYLFGKTGRK